MRALKGGRQVTSGTRRMGDTGRWQREILNLRGGITVWPQETAIENSARGTLETGKQVIKVESENHSKLKTLKEVNRKQI